MALFGEEDRMGDEPQDTQPEAEKPQEPAGGASPSEPSAKTVEELEQRNAQLRDQNRKLSAKALGKEHGFPDAVVDLLASVDLDHQEERAKALAEQLSQRTPAEPKPEEPKDAPKVAAMDEGADKGDAPKAPAMPGDETLGRIKEIDPRDATERLKEIQREALGKLRGTL